MVKDKIAAEQEARWAACTVPRIPLFSVIDAWMRLESYDSEHSLVVMKA